MNDRKLLELAGKAAGFTLMFSTFSDDVPPRRTDDNSWNTWDPLKDDGDALRLVVKLKLSIEWDGCEVQVRAEHYDSNDPLYACEVKHDALDYEAATRRAIVRCAAIIGEAMP